jgi:gluconolactonase
MGFGWLRIFLVCGALSGQDFSEIQFERNSTGHRFTDSPVWSAAVAGVLFADVPNNTILAFMPGKGVGKYKTDLAGPSGLAYDAEGRLIVAETRGRRLLRFPVDDKKPVEVLAERFEGKRLNAPNDVVVRKDGQIYFTDPAFGIQQDTMELAFYGVYHLTPKGELNVIAKPKGRPNGIALSPNGKVLYVTNSDERRIYAYDLDGRGAASGERVLVAKTEGIPGGMETDEKGNLYVAENTLRVYSAQGKLINALTLSEKPSNVAFGDADGLTLYITAQTGLYRTRVKVGGTGFSVKSSEAPANER